MKAILVVLTIAAATFALGFSNDPHWFAYKQTFGKVFADDDIESYRYSVFTRNMADAARLNAIDPSATYSWTPVSDHDISELTAPMQVPEDIFRTNIYSSANPPADYDWRSKGAVAPVKDQGQCGSCWAFCTVCSMEGAHFIKHNELVRLSESNIVDCDKNDHGCNGGWPTTAMNWIIANGGIMTEADYPYVPRQQTCKFVASKAKAFFTKSFTFAARNPTAMKDALVKYGPLSVAVDARKFNSYSSGVMTASGCYAGAPTHGITAVGWSKEGSIEYWIVKNSWGASWGERGYVRMQLGTNACGVEDYPMGIDSK